MRKKSIHKEIMTLFEELHDKYPTQDIGRHISLAFADYGDIFNVSDKEFLFGLEKYMAEVDLDISPIADEEYVHMLEMDSEHLFDEEQEDEF